MKLLRSIPALPVREIDEAVRFYQGQMGFTTAHHDEEFAIVKREDVELHLWAANDDRERRHEVPASFRHWISSEIS